MQIEGYEFPEELYYDDHHQYARVENDAVTFGLSHYAQATAREIVYVELPRVGRKLEQGKPIGTIESGKWVGRLYALVSGEVIGANALLADDAGMINRDPYGAGWIVRVRMREPEQLSALRRCTDPGFVEWFRAEIEKNKPK